MSHSLIRAAQLGLRTKSIGAMVRNAYGYVREPFAGAWQQGVSIDPIGTVTSYSAVYASASGIANDAGKLRLRVVRQDRTSGVWTEDRSADELAVLTRPNRYQTRLQFIVNWLLTKLLHGNAYVLLVRSGRAEIVQMHVLDPRRVQPQVAPDGGVYYSIGTDMMRAAQQLSDRDTTILPYTEIIHDRGPTLWHPLIGVSPITACGLSATMGMRIQRNSAAFFENMSRPGGMVTAPGTIDEATATRLKAEWQANYSGANIGRIALLGDGLKYEAMPAIAAHDAQLIDQLRWTVEDVARAFNYPSHRLSNGQVPGLSSLEALEAYYYANCLQAHLEGIELCLDRAFFTQYKDMSITQRTDIGIEFDLDGLLRMDTAARFKAFAEGVGGGWLAPNEARARENLPPVVGGDSPMAQQQNYSLQALARRDAQPDPFDSGDTPRTRSVAARMVGEQISAFVDTLPPDVQAAVKSARAAQQREWSRRQ